MEGILQSFKPNLNIFDLDINEKIAIEINAFRKYILMNFEVFILLDVIK